MRFLTISFVISLFLSIISERIFSIKSLSLGYPDNTSASAFDANAAKSPYTRSTHSKDGLSRREISLFTKNSNAESDVKSDPDIPPMFVMRTVISFAE